MNQKIKILIGVLVANIIFLSIIYFQMSLSMRDEFYQRLVFYVTTKKSTSSNIIKIVGLRSHENICERDICHTTVKPSVKYLTKDGKLIICKADIDRKFLFYEVKNETCEVQEIRNLTKYLKNPLYCEKDSDCVVCGAIGGSGCSCGCECLRNYVKDFLAIPTDKNNIRQIPSTTCLRECPLVKVEAKCENNLCVCSQTLLSD